MTKQDLAKALHNFVERYRNPLEGAKAAQDIMRPFGSFRVNGINPSDYGALIEKLR